MPNLLSMIAWRPPLMPLFDPRTLHQVQRLGVGMMLVPGQCTVSSALYAGLQAEGNFALYHHILSRAIGASLAVSEVLRGLWVPYRVSARGPIRLGER